MEALVYGLLILTSVLGLAFIVERGWSLRWRHVVPGEVESAVEALGSRQDIPALRRVCEQKPCAASRLVLAATERLDRPRAEIADALQTRARHEMARLERGLVVLEIIVGIAPLLGLVGTIAGMMTLFGDIGQSGIPEANRLARGIALILRATLMGLLIAIPSLIFWSYYSKKVETLAVELESICDELLRKLFSNSDSEPNRGR